MYESADFRFKKLEAEDKLLLHDWLNRPHVASRWGGPKSLVKVEEDYFAPDEKQKISRYIVYLSEQPCGFIQSYKTIECDGGWWPDHRNEGIVGIDFFIGEDLLLNHGVGRAMISAFIGAITHEGAVKKVIADPAVQNLQSINCLLKVGFINMGVIETPDGQAVLMEYSCERT